MCIINSIKIIRAKKQTTLKIDSKTNLNELEKSEKGYMTGKQITDYISSAERSLDSKQLQQFSI